jgi:hypothetical protein
MKPGSADPHADVRFSSSGAVNRSNDAPLAGRLNLVIDGALARNRIVGTTILIFLEALRTRNNPILQPGSIELMTKNAIGATAVAGMTGDFRDSVVRAVYAV